LCKRPKGWLYILSGIPLFLVACVGVAAGIVLCMTIVLSIPGFVLILFTCYPLYMLIQMYINRLNAWKAEQSPDLDASNGIKPWELN
jgi:hypothetical protein